jgi:hypothetical protein
MDKNVISNGDRQPRQNGKVTNPMLQKIVSRYVEGGSLGVLGGANR